MKSEETAVVLSPEDFKLLKQVSRFLEDCTVEQAAIIVNEVLMLHPMMAWNPVTKLMIDIESVNVNGQVIQLNIEEYEE